MAAVLLAMAASSTGCRADHQPTETSRSSSTAPTSVGGDRWLAAIEIAVRADDLDAATERVRAALGPALVVSPVDCFDGLPAAAGEGYVIGALAASRAAAEASVVEAGEPVLFTASVTILCTD